MAGAERSKVDAIFDSDPLLLERQNQDAYGRIIVDNLLTNRAFHKQLIRNIDLHQPPPPEDAEDPRTADDLADAYVKSRKFRLPLEVSAEDLKLLSQVTMVCDAQYTGARINSVDGVRQIPSASAMVKRNSDDKRLRIAAIGYRVKISRLVGRPGVKTEDLVGFIGPGANKLSGLPDCHELLQLGRTALAEKAQDLWTPTICKQIQHAIARGSHVIVLPEFALPPARENLDIEEEIRKCSTDVEGASPDCFIFAGSRHEGSYNRGLLLHRKMGKFSPKDQWHYKIASARSMGENILGPRTHQVVSYSVPIEINEATIPLNVVVAICYDAFDPSTFLRLLLLSARQHLQSKDRIILVPSFNSGTRFVEMLRDLSFLARCPVVYVNGLHGDVRMFISGVAVRDILNKAAQIKVQVAEVLAAKEMALAAVNPSGDEDDFAELPTSETSELHECIAVLRVFMAQLQDMEKRGSLQHIVSVEDCVHCANGDHPNDYECLSDIVYYNLDYELIRNLVWFRNHYFGDHEEFLPEPLRGNALKQRAMQMTT